METKTIYKKISESKNEFGVLVKDAENPFFKSSYLSLNALLSTIEPVFIEHGLLLLQPIENGKVSTEIISLEDGSKVVSSIEIPQINDPQKLGSAITYFRRYSLQSLLGLQAEDDDANEASKPQKEETAKFWLNKWNKDKTKVLDLYTKVVNSAKEKGKTVSDLREFYKISKEIEKELEKDLK